MADTPLLVLLDGNSLLHRAWHAIPPLTTREGLVVNAVYGFCVVLDKLLEETKPTHMAVAWDLKGGTFRNELFADYKAQRAEKSQDLYDQIPMIQEVLEAYGITSVSSQGFEADDVIGTLATEGEKTGFDVKIVTGDLDALQLVTDKIHVVFFQKGVSQTKEYDIEAVKERYTLTPEQLIDYKSFRGDTSDNIPGVRGIGEKTATELIHDFGSVEGVFKALEKGEVKEKTAKYLRGAEETALLTKKLVKIVVDVKLPVKPKKLDRKKVDSARLLDLFRKYEFRSLLKKHGNDFAPPPPVGAVSKKTSNSKKRVFPTVEAKNITDLRSWFLGHKGEELAFVYSEQLADLFGQTVASLCVATRLEAVVCSHPSNEVLMAVREGLMAAPRLIVNDAKSCMHLFGASLTSHVFDLMLAGYALSPGERAYDVATLAQIHESELSANAKDLKIFSIESALPEQVSHLHELADVLEKDMEETGVKKLYETIELPLVPVLFAMEKTGITLDVDVLHKAKERLRTQVDSLIKQIYEMTGEEFNINSPQQMAEVLFTRLALSTKGIKKTKQGFSTAASELDKLEGTHEVIPLIREYRELTKLLSTYIEPLPGLVGSDGRIHTSYNQTVAATGRLSSSNPNLQNIPLRSAEGMEIRKAFVAGKGKRLISVDYSQIEIRLVAVIAKDQPFIKAFQDGADIHTRTAAEVFGKEESEVTENERRAAKAINFGILYGMGSRSLARSTGLTQDQAKEFIEKYFSIHSAIRDYIEATKAQAHSLGYVETLFGRRRYVPEISSGLPQLVAMTERMAVNMPVQGTEADVVKLAMISLAHWLDTSGWPAKLLLQVHDEFVLEVAEEAVDVVARGVREIMESVVSYEVPLEVNIEVGKSWGDMDAWEPKR